MLGTEPQIEEKYVKTGQVQLIFNPVLNHSDRSDQSHQAVECAGEQNQFWSFRQVLFQNQDRLWRGDIRTTVKELAAESGLDTAAFNTCIDEQRYLDLIRQQDQLRLDKGIPFQPSFDVNEQRLIGSQSYEIFVDAIEKELP